MDTVKIAAQAVELFGANHQLCKVIEELSECAAAATRVLELRLEESAAADSDLHSVFLPALIDEVADVYVTLAQLPAILGHDVEDKIGLASLQAFQRLERLIAMSGGDEE